MEYLIPFIVFLGIPLGLLLAKIAKEEIKPGQRYFVLIKKIILFILIILLLYHTKSYLWLFIGIIAGYIISLYTEEYIYLGIALMLSFFYSNSIILLTASLIFIYSIIYGTLTKPKYKTIITLLIIFIAPFIFIISKFPQYDPVKSCLIGIASAGLFSFLIRK